VEKPPIILSVHTAGTPQFPRYFISDQYKRVWTGESWSDDEGDGLLYGESNAACVEVQRLLLLDYMDKPVRRFRAPVYLDLFTDKELTKEQIARWLVKVSRLLIDSPQHGVGPLSGTLGLVRIEWGELKGVKE
jgi:hypothetical protein